MQGPWLSADETSSALQLLTAVRQLVVLERICLVLPLPDKEAPFVKPLKRLRRSLPRDSAAAWEVGAGDPVNGAPSTGTSSSRATTPCSARQTGCTTRPPCPWCEGRASAGAGLIPSRSRPYPKRPDSAAHSQRYRDAT